MAIHWCDPYLNTSTGGIHGTTTSGQSSGDGSYASPWSLTELNDQNNYSGWSDGDELRFKGLAEDTFFPPANSSAFKQSDRTTDYIPTTTYNGYYNQSLYLANGTDNKLIRLKQQDRDTLTGKTLYYKQYNNNQLITIITEGTWWPNLPPVDVPYGYIPLDDRYQITVNMNGGSTGRFLQYIPVRIIITAGWTSETEQNGITVLDANSTSVFGSTCVWGGQSNDDALSPLPVWDCEDTLILSRYTSSSNWYLYGSVVNIKCLTEASNNYSDWTIIVGPRTNADTSTMPAGYNMGDASIDSILCCNIHFSLYGASYSNHLASPSINIPFIVDYGATQNRFNSYIELTYYLKEYYGYSAFQWDGDTSKQFKFVIADNWNFEISNNSPSSFQFNSGYSDEIKTFIANNSVIGTGPYSYKSLAGWPDTVTKEVGFALYQIFQSNVVQGIKGYNTTDKIFSSAGLFEQIQYANIFQNSGFIESLDTKGVTLEDTTISPIEFTLSSVYPWQMRLNVRQEPSRMLPVTLLQPTSSGKAAMLYNSPNFNYKKAIRFFTECNGKTYVDVVAYDMPTFSSDVTFNAEYETTSTPGVSLTNKLYLYDISTNRFVNIANISGSVNGTTITCNTTISSSTLANKAGLLIVLHDFSKTSTDVSEVAYNSVTVT